MNKLIWDDRRRKAAIGGAGILGGIGVGGLIWWGAKGLSPACGPLAPVCAVALTRSIDTWADWARRLRYDSASLVAADLDGIRESAQAVLAQLEALFAGPATKTRLEDAMIELELDAEHLLWHLRELQSRAASAGDGKQGPGRSERAPTT